MENDLTVQGFQAAAVKAAIRKKDRLDLGLIYSEVPATAAGVFTTSRVKAAPVLLGMERLAHGRAQAVLINSGIANACTGAEGMSLARKTAALTAEALGIAEELVQVSSTGVIGEQLRLDSFAQGIPLLASSLSPDGFVDVARAMMTTDTAPKAVSRTISINGREVRLVGLAKGAGMIMPNMATMLSFIMTNAAVALPTLRAVLKESVDTSFNAITIDGDTSTNDTVLILANGLAGNSVIEESRPRELAVFRQALGEVCQELARMIVADGEGATKFITIRVDGAASAEDAERAARTIANSSLVKTAFFGEDANWGRIMAALGRSGADFAADRVDIAFDRVVLVRNGLGLGPEVEAQAAEVLRQKEFAVAVNLHNGTQSRAIHTCDFSFDYVKINADYRT